MLDSFRHNNVLLSSYRSNNARMTFLWPTDSQFKGHICTNCFVIPWSSSNFEYSFQHYKKRAIWCTWRTIVNISLICNHDLSTCLNLALYMKTSHTYILYGYFMHWKTPQPKTNFNNAENSWTALMFELRL